MKKNIFLLSLVAVLVGAYFSVANPTTVIGADPINTCPTGTAQVYKETITVPSNSATATLGSALVSGQNYLLVSSGSWLNTGKNVADAEYTSLDNWVTQMDGYNIDPYFLGEGEFDLQVDNTFINWGSYNLAHSYSHLYTGTGNPISFLIFDGDATPAQPVLHPEWYGDNSGSLTVDIFSCEPTSGQVHIFKYLNGVQATPTSANNVSFPMFTTFNAPNIGAYSNIPFTLKPGGWTTGDIDYEASTSVMNAGSSYSAWEDTSTPLVGATCDNTHPYALAGYTIGTTLAEASVAVPTETVPSITSLSGDKYIIVWNKTCQVTVPIKVHILKYLNGAQATANNVPNGYQFPMTATWQTANLDGGVSTSGNYVLGNNHGGAADQYGADTSPMSVPADYTTSEITDNSSQVVSSAELCAPGKYLLNGYRTSSISFADAASQPITLIAPQFVDLDSDRYVIVDNSSCPTTGSLTVTKLTNGGNDTFSFSGDVGNFNITTSEGTGSMTFNNLVPGNYTITEINLPSGWQQTNTDCNAVAVTAGAEATCDITNTKVGTPKLGEIRGKKFDDKYGEGAKNHREKGLAGWTIYLDTNDNGSLDSGEPFTVTKKNGIYRFKGLLAGTYHVREVGQAGWVQTYPATGEYIVTLTAGKISKKNDFGNFKLGTILGMKFNDLNGNGHKDKNEPGLTGWTINLTKPDHSVISVTTDTNGNYSFVNLGPGTYQVREVQQETWHQTTKNPKDIKMYSGGLYKNINFGNRQGEINNGHQENDEEDNDHDNNRHHWSPKR